MPMLPGVTTKLRKKQWGLIIVIAVILSVIMTTAIELVLPLISDHPVKEEKQIVTEKVAPLPQQESIPARPIAETRVKPADTKQVIPVKEQSDIGEELTVGTVTIMNTDGMKVSEFSAPVINGSWLALPTRACIGGDKWFFKVGNDPAIPIKGGLWGRGDAVGLWQLDGDKTYAGPEFTTWQQDKPVRLLSMKTGKLSDPMTLIPSGVSGTLLYSSLRDPIDAGVFLQNDKVVGWSLGDLLPGAYMWVLGDADGLIYQNYVDDFYNETFAGGREELFSIALSRGRSVPPQRELQMFTEAFRVPPKLSPQDTPQFLTPGAVYPYILKLVNFMMGQGDYQSVASLANEPLLRELKDPELLMNVTRATLRSYGFGLATNLLEVTVADLRKELEEKYPKVRQFYMGLYTEWIKTVLDAGDTARGWQIYNRAITHFHDSPELHLLAVELSLATGDWQEAETLLYQRQYPPELRETWMRLADRISDVKGQENKIVIKFQPGSSEISSNAILNDGFDQNFLIDTGATYVTIPYSTVESLGLEDKMSQHQQEVQTPGGPVKANAVTLSSIELQGWVVPNVEALVMDLPNRPGLGLLGLNFLNSFRLDLQADEGILILEPK